MAPTSPSLEAEQDRLLRNFFYRDGTPASAAAMFEQFLAELPVLMRDEAKQEVVSQGLLYFTRVAQGRPAVLRAFEAIAAGLPAERLPVVVKLLMHAGDETTLAFLRGLAPRAEVAAEMPGLADELAGGIGPDPEIEAMWALPIEHPAQLDLRWTDFMATGDRRKVAEIFAVLAWAEHLREALRPKLAPVKGLFARLAGGEGKRRKRIAALERLGLRIDVKTGEILNREDVDIFAITSDLSFDARRLAVVRGLEVLTPALLMTLALKTSAIWSLGLNGVEHPVVLEVCEEEARKMTGAGRLSALELVATIHRRRQDAPAALRAVTELLAASPDRKELQAEVEALRVAALFAKLREGLVGEGRRETLDGAAGAAAAGRCAEALGRAPGYIFQAKYTLEAAPGPETRMTRSAWRGQVAGARIRVWRAFWTQEDEGLADEWIDVDGVNYMQGPGMWLRPPADFNSRGAENLLVRADWLVPLLKGVPDRSATVMRSRGWFELVFAAADVGDVLAILGVPAGVVEVTLTIDAETHWPARVVVRAGAGMVERFEWETMLVVPAGPVRIEAPEAIDMSKATRQ